MITITKISTDNESKLIGEIDNKEYCITYNKDIHTKLEELSLNIDSCQSFEEWTKIIEKANVLVSDTIYVIKNSKYFVKINESFYITNGKKYYNIEGSDIISNTLNFYIGKGLNIDKFAIFLVRKGKSEILKLKNIYHRINKNGNIRVNIKGTLVVSREYYSLNTATNIIISSTHSVPRYFTGTGDIVSSNKTYSLKSLGTSFSEILESSDEGLPVLIKPDLSCQVGDLEVEGLLIDSDDETDWSDYLTSFIDKYGKNK